MGELADFLYFAGREVEAHLQAHRVEVITEDLESALPQSWRFETEKETAVLHLDTVGHISVSTESTEAPEVIVRWAQRPLVDTLQRTRRRSHVPEPLPSIHFASEAGRKAFRMLGISLGL